MLRNLFHVPIRIFERKLTNGEIEYWCQYQNIFGKWKNRIKYGDYIQLYTTTKK